MKSLESMASESDIVLNLGAFLCGGFSEHAWCCAVKVMQEMA